MAGEQGFEPQLPDPESGVLPIKLFPSGNLLLLPRQSGKQRPLLYHGTPEMPNFSVGKRHIAPWI